jgi:hypothetical protein
MRLRLLVPAPPAEPGARRRRRTEFPASHASVRLATGALDIHNQLHAFLPHLNSRHRTSRLDCTKDLDRLRMRGLVGPAVERFRNPHICTTCTSVRGQTIVCGTASTGSRPVRRLLLFWSSMRSQPIVWKACRLAIRCESERAGPREMPLRLRESPRAVACETDGWRSFA